MNRKLIKVCGMCHAENIRQVATLGADYIGLIFYPKSPRYVSMQSTSAGIIPDVAPASIARSLDSSSDKAGRRPRLVGVFVDDMAQNIITRVVNYRLDVVQLHGSETPTLIDNLRRTLDPDIRPGIQIWKAIAIGEDATQQDIEALTAPYEEHVDAFLFDTRCATQGGSGRHFDWSVLEGYQGKRPFMLSGGIGPDDAPSLKTFSHPSCMGFDLNSRFETAPGLKDTERIAQFMSCLC